MHDLVAAGWCLVVANIFLRFLRERLSQCQPAGRPAPASCLIPARETERETETRSLSLSQRYIGHSHKWSVCTAHRWGQGPGTLRHVMRIELLAAATAMRKFNSLPRQFTPEVLRSDLARAEVLHSLAWPSIFPDIDSRHL